MKKRVLISGGSRGIGAECVRAFALHGERVAFIYNKSTDAAATLEAETGARGFCGDLSDMHAAADVAERAIEYLGGIDVLVNCAGVASFSLFTDISDDEWRRVIDTNLSSAFVLCRSASKAMISQKYGRIINIGSVWGRLGASCEVHYSASKAALRGLTQALAKELGPSGITVNCVEPGVIDTDMNSVLSEETIAELIDSTPVCRIGKCEDVAAAVLFLASDSASFITSATIPVDGGFPT